jgi:hypothetical protein
LEQDYGQEDIGYSDPPTDVCGTEPEGDGTEPEEDETIPTMPDDVPSDAPSDVPENEEQEFVGQQSSGDAVCLDFCFEYTRSGSQWRPVSGGCPFQVCSVAGMEGVQQLVSLFLAALTSSFPGFQFRARPS